MIQANPGIDAPEDVETMAEKVDDIEQMQACIVDLENYDDIETDGLAIRVYIQHKEWYRTNYHPNIYERVNYLLNNVGNGWNLVGMETLHKDNDEGEDNEDFIVTRLFLQG